VDAALTVDDLDPNFAALAAEARRLEPRVGRVSTRTSADFSTVMVIETAGLTTTEVGALSDALKAFRRSRDLAAEFVVVNATGGEFVPRVPSGDRADEWPPVP
jgi:uncharacterized membrane protein YgcG